MQVPQNLEWEWYKTHKDGIHVSQLARGVFPEPAC